MIHKALEGEENLATRACKVLYPKPGWGVSGEGHSIKMIQPSQL